MNTFLSVEGKSCVEGFKSFVNIAINKVPPIYKAVHNHFSEKTCLPSEWQEIHISYGSLPR